MRNYDETLNWYKTHQTTRQIGFDPDGMCMKVCRTARGIGAMYPSAKQGQDATPKEYRVYKVEDLRKGMVLYFDDPNDSNAFGHIVTMVGRVKGSKRSDLNGVLVETNSVKSNELVVVRATYFKQHWGDSFKFGATWLNGQVLDVPYPKSVDEFPKSVNRVEQFWKSRPTWNLKLLEQAIKVGKRRDLSQQVGDIREAIRDLPTSKNKKVVAFKKSYEENDVVRLHLLTEVVKADARAVRIKSVRDRISRSIKSVPRH